MSAKPRSDGDWQKVYGRTLGEALRRVRTRWGEEARIVATRTVVRAGSDGRGENRLVEVTVAEPPAPAVEPAGIPRRRRELPAVLERLAADVARLEALAARLHRREEAAKAGNVPAHPLAATLLKRGASPAAVRRLADLWRAETGATAGSAAARRHLAAQFRTGGGVWRRLAGRHLVIGPPGSGRSSLVLAAARALVRHGRRTLVLLPEPSHAGAVQRLREAAADHGFDAAILRGGANLPGALDRVGAYDVVLVDGPAVGPGAPAATVTPRALAQTEIHRHLLVPVDADPAARPALWEAARRWTCDWIALGRLDTAARPGQLLDLLLGAPLPVSLVHHGPGPRAVDLATPELLVSLVLGAGHEDAPAVSRRDVAEVSA